MKQNLSLRRIFLLVLTSVLMSAVVMMTIYSMVTPQIFAQAKYQEFLPRVQFLVERGAEYFASGRDIEYLDYFSIDSKVWGATITLLDKDRNVVVHNDATMIHSEFAQQIAGFNEVIVPSLLSGENIVDLGYVNRPATGRRTSDLLIIGMPVVVEGKVEGAVILIKPLDEIISAMSSLFSALWFAMFAVMAVMLPVIYWFSRRLSHPIRQMRDIAMRMAGGDFTIRANERENGEMGDLARALNYLSGELSRSIIEVTRERNQAVTIVNALSEGVLSVNTQGMPMMTNPALQTMLITAGHGKPAQMPQAVWDEFNVALKEGCCTESTFLLGDMLLRLTITPIVDQRTGIVSAIGVFHDETQAHQLEQTRREYVANVSHELRTPLTAVRALIEPLRDGLIKTEEQRQDTYNIILRETMRLSRLVDDMLELSRLQSGRLALEKVRFDAEKLLRETASTYAAKAADTGHQLLLNLGEEALPTVLGNQDRAEQVLVALLNNAFTYTPPDSSITIGVTVGEKCLYIYVQDTGPGIAPQDLPHLFDRFYKADKSHGGTGGTGLGLAISKEVMERLGEDIYAENVEGGGAKFTFTLHYQ